MWLISLLPDALLHTFVMLMFFGGIVGFIVGSFANMFGPMGRYALLIKVVSGLMVALGLYLYGGYDTEMKWRAKAAELQAKIDAKYKQSDIVTEHVVTEYKTKVKVVKEKGDVIIKEIPKYISKETDAECRIPDSIRLLHNSAARNEIPGTASATDGTGTTTTTSK